jgi:hypothetical protein
MSEVPRLTSKMITNELLSCFNQNLEWIRAFDEALAEATTEEQKRKICERFRNDALREAARWRAIRENAY